MATLEVLGGCVDSASHKIRTRKRDRENPKPETRNLKPMNTGDCGGATVGIAWPAYAVSIGGGSRRRRRDGGVGGPARSVYEARQ